MPFSRAVYALTYLVKSFYLFDAARARALTMRALELYYRSVCACPQIQLSGAAADTQKTDMHAVTCLRIVYAMYGVNEDFNPADLVISLHNIGTSCTVSDLNDIQRAVLASVCFDLLPSGGSPVDETSFCELWRFVRGLDTRPLDYVGPFADAVAACVDAHFDAMDLFQGIHSVGCLPHPDFFFLNTHYIQAETKEMHANMVLYCKSDHVFGSFVEIHCLHAFGLPPLHTTRDELASAALHPSGAAELMDLRRRMVLSFHRVVLRSIHDVTPTYVQFALTAPTRQWTGDTLYASISSFELYLMQARVLIHSVASIHPPTSVVLATSFNALIRCLEMPLRAIMPNVPELEFQDAFGSVLVYEPVPA